MKLQRKSTIKNNRKNGNRKKIIIREKTRENLRGEKELEKKPKKDGGEKKTIHGNVKGVIIIFEWRENVWWCRSESWLWAVGFNKGVVRVGG
jgi:hypothetical protein